MKTKYLLLTGILLSSLALSSCQEEDVADGYTKIDYQVGDRDRYDNIFRENIPEQWENYGIGDPFLMRYNGEYYLYVSSRDGNPGVKAWKSRDLVNFEYCGLLGLYNKDGTSTDGQLGQFAPEVYYWNGDFYMYGSPAGNGHFIYKSDDGTPTGNFVAVTDNLGLSIDGSVFIDDDESMTFMVAGSGAIVSYAMDSMTEIDAYDSTSLLSPLIKWVEGPCMIKHNDTYYLTYTGNHVKSKGYRVDYSYSTESAMTGFNYPSNNSILLKTLDEQNGLGHSSNVLGPNLDSYYISYHSLDTSSGPTRSYNINRLSFANNRMSVYGPTDKGALVALLPEFVSYEDDGKMEVVNNLTLSNVASENRFSVEYNFKGINANGNSKLIFSSNDGSEDNYITINGKSVELYVANNKVGTGTLVHDFDFTKMHTIRLNVENGHYRVYFDNMKKIEVTGQASVTGGKVGYKNVNEIGTTTFSNEAFDSSDRVDPKVVPGEFFASTYLEESNVKADATYNLEEDDVDADYIYSGSSAVKLNTPGEYVLYPIDCYNDALYGLEILAKQTNAGAILSLQIDNEEATLFTLNSVDFTSNMNCYEDELEFIKQFVCETKINKGLHTLKIELVKGEVDLSYINLFESSEYQADYTNDMSKLITEGSNYLSLWRIVEDEGVNVHKAKSGTNNMLLLGSTSMTDYEISADVKVTVSSGNNSMAGFIVRCNNPSLYSGYIDESAQGYYIAFNRLQLVLERINYNSSIVAVDTGSQYTLGEWHNLKVRCIANKIEVYYDNEFVYSYTDPNPFSHGVPALYSINSESYYKNVVIKGI